MIHSPMMKLSGMITMEMEWETIQMEIWQIYSLINTHSGKIQMVTDMVTITKLVLLNLIHAHLISAPVIKIISVVMMMMEMDGPI